MVPTFVWIQLAHYRKWWRAPISRRDRVVGGMVGLFGGFWVGLLGWVALGPTPATFASLCAWVVVAVLVGAVAGAKWPKVSTLILFPFATFGGGT